VTETRYLIPPGADWAVWDDVNGVLTFMTDAEVIANARENERELGDEFARSPLPADPTPEDAWVYVNELWEGDPSEGSAKAPHVGALWVQALAGNHGGSPAGTSRAAFQTAAADGSIGTRMWRRRACPAAYNLKSRLGRVKVLAVRSGEAAVERVPARSGEWLRRLPRSTMADRRRLGIRREVTPLQDSAMRRSARTFACETC
jgi:hypothetical protein